MTWLDRMLDCTKKKLTDAIVKARRIEMSVKGEMFIASNCNERKSKKTAKAKGRGGEGKGGVE
jgi:hypothetical protein